VCTKFILLFHLALDKCPPSVTELFSLALASKMGVFSRSHTGYVAMLHWLYILLCSIFLLKHQSPLAIRGRITYSILKIMLGLISFIAYGLGKKN
jgi:hypothetical protein